MATYDYINMRYIYTYISNTHTLSQTGFIQVWVFNFAERRLWTL